MTRPVDHLKKDGFDVYTPRGEADRWRLVKACIDEDVDQKGMLDHFPATPAPIRIRRDGVEVCLETLAYANPKRMVFRVSANGETFILKRARMGTVGLKRLIPWAVGLTYFTRIMRLVDAAMRNGCRLTQRYHLVAEKSLSPFRHEVWVLMEYLEGESFAAKAASPEWRLQLEHTAKELLRHGLTMDDLTPHNFLICDGTIKAIDLSCRPFTRLQAVKMAMKMNARYGIRLPQTGVMNRAIKFVLSIRNRLRGGEAGIVA